MKLRKLFSFSLFASLLLVSVGPVSAQTNFERRNVKQNSEIRVQSTSEPRKTPEGRERSCEVIMRNTKTRSESLVKMARNMLTKFDSILSSVKNYYTGIVVPSGKTVPNYQQLIADTDAKKAAVEEALSKATSDLGSLSCENDNPKEAVMTFNNNMRAVKTALANYRTSIKNVIRAVHGFKRPTGSPKSTFLPRQTSRPKPDGSPKPFSPRPERQINPPSI
jgi:hypothetical protein